MKDFNPASQPIGTVATVALLVLNEEADLADAAAILSGAGLRTMLSRTCREALRQISGGQPRIVLCDKQLPDGDWKDIIGWLADDPEPPRMIVLAGDDSAFYAEAINLGAYDVLMRPLDGEELRRVALIACGVPTLRSVAARRLPAKALSAAAGTGASPMGSVLLANALRA